MRFDPKSAKKRPERIQLKNYCVEFLVSNTRDKQSKTTYKMFVIIERARTPIMQVFPTSLMMSEMGSFSPKRGETFNPK